MHTVVGAETPLKKRNTIEVQSYITAAKISTTTAKIRHSVLLLFFALC